MTKIIKVFENYSKIEELILFGSRALGTYSNGSDIDLSIKGKELTVNDILSLSTKIDDLYLPYQIDIVIYENIKETALIKHIDKFGIQLMNKENKH